MRLLLVALLLVVLGIGAYVAFQHFSDQGSDSRDNSQQVNGSSHYCGDTNYDGREETPCLTTEEIQSLFGAGYKPASASSERGIFEYRYVGGGPDIRFAIANGPRATETWQNEVKLYSHLDGWKYSGDITMDRGAWLVSATEVHVYKDVHNHPWWFKIMIDGSDDSTLTSIRLRQAATLALGRFPEN